MTSGDGQYRVSEGGVLDEVGGWLIMTCMDELLHLGSVLAIIGMDGLRCKLCPLWP